MRNLLPREGERRLSAYRTQGAEGPASGFLTGDFTDLRVAGIIYDRQVSRLYACVS